MALPIRALVVLAIVASATSAAAEQSPAERAYYRAVAGFFQVPESEIAILGHGGEVPAEEIPVVLFMARRGGVSSEAVVALRGSGRGWTELAQRFGVGAPALHVPLRDATGAGAMVPLYQKFAATPMEQWSSMRLEGPEIVALVNLRVLSQALGVEPDQVAGRTGTVASFVELYGTFLH
ncbi:MAG: hypothetical protein ABL963_14670 [Longimicrobiales bacterium]